MMKIDDQFKHISSVVQEEYKGWMKDLAALGNKVNSDPDYSFSDKRLATYAIDALMKDLTRQIEELNDVPPPS